MLRLLSTAVVALAAVVCGAMWALSSPPGSSPDDGYHQTTIWCVDATTSPSTCRVVGESETTGGPVVEVPALVANASCYAFAPAESGACQRTLEGQRTTTEAIDDGSYPGGFYRVMHLLVRDSVPESIVVMRVFNVALAALLLGAIALVSTASVRRLMVLTLAPVLVPLGWFILASVNPSSWALSGLTAYGFALHTLLLADGRRRIVAGVLGGVGLAMALSARGDAPVYAGVVTVALCALHWRTVWADKRLLALPVVVGAVCLWRVLVAAQVASIAGASAETERTLREVVPNLLVEWPALFSGMFGYAFGLGWLDTAVNSVTAYPVALIIGFLGLSGLGRMSPAKAVAAVLIFLPMVVLPLMTLYRTRLIVGESVQPRYILPLMPMLLAVLLTERMAGRTLRLGRVQSVLIWLALTVATTAAIYANARRYVTGVDGPTLIDDLEWWWQSAPSPAAVTLIGGAAFAVFAAPLVVMHWRRPSDVPAVADDTTRPHDGPRTEETA
ncbi:MAG TPA: DUF2142 domain-containing protein [Nocardioides sp.]|nr:DUF2142 domain-containing protein [Nocardioides sp.]